MKIKMNREKYRILLLSVMSVTAITAILTLIILSSIQSVSAKEIKKTAQSQTAQSVISDSASEPSAVQSQASVSASSKIPDTGKVIYSNQQYGFTFALPLSWKGYTIVTDTWSGTKYGQNGEEAATSGPIIKIRDPRWISQVPRQDIPIMVFTRSQWNSLQKNEYHIGAAPIGPAELGQNDRYVFALPARYNFYNLPGIDEVSDIIDSKPLDATAPAGN